jgi:integrase
VTWRVRQVLKAAGFQEPTEKGLAKRGKGEELLVRVKRKGNGLRQASVRDFHSFRVTWITLALSAGVPLELVRKVTGHATVDIVLKHYFQPGREGLRDALNKSMPKLLMNGKHSDPKVEMGQIIRSMTPKSLAKDREKLIELLSAV